MCIRDRCCTPRSSSREAPPPGTAGHAAVAPRHQGSFLGANRASTKQTTEPARLPAKHPKAATTPPQCTATTAAPAV
eukprot:11717042-Alexandrium_andersonii.AAC.1